MVIKPRLRIADINYAGAQIHQLCISFGTATPSSVKWVQMYAVVHDNPCGTLSQSPNKKLSGVQCRAISLTLQGFVGLIREDFF